MTGAGPAHGSLPTVAEPRPVSDRTVASRPDPRGSRRGSRRLPSGLLGPVLALVLWGWALATADVRSVGQYGLLPDLPPAWFLALVVLLASAVRQLRARERPTGPVMALHVVALVLLFHATVPVLESEPQYGWTYKHIGVVEYISRHGSLTPDTDIYQQWPAFFSAVAALADLSGVRPLAFAEWAPVLFNLLDALLLSAVCRALRPSDARLAFVVPVLYVCSSWVGQDYLAPQAMGTTLALGVQLLVLQFLRRPTVETAPGDRPGRVRAWLSRGAEPVVPVPPMVARTALAGTYLAFAVLVATHQLTPYVVLLGVGGLVVLRVVRPRHVVLALAVIAVAYLVPRYGFLSERFQIFSGFDVSANAKSNIRGTGSAGSRLTSLVVRGLSAGMWLTATAVVLTSLRRPGRVLVPAALFLAPFSLFVGQSYGGEGVFRVYLFSLPWACFLVGTVLVRLRRPSWVRSAATLAGLAVVSLACLQGLYGQLAVNRISPAEVQASEYVYDHALPGSVLVLAAHTFPTRLRADYPDLMPRGSQADGNLLETDRFDGRVLDRSALPDVEATVRDYGAQNAYLVVSRSQEAFVSYFGFLPPGSLGALRQTLEQAPGWTRWYQNDDVVVFQHLGRDYQAAPGTRSPTP